jgi:ubiquinone/menaquinone biosynthesis C-methylase UbiE
MTTTLNNALRFLEKKRFNLMNRFRPIVWGEDVHRYKHALAASAWRQKYFKENGRLAENNQHYLARYTTLFDLDRSFYSGKRILDIGCGPRGSLEWADDAIERVGLDPLVPVYRRFGIMRHGMSYVAAGSESIPFPDGHFSVVTTINSLDHVDDFGKTAFEMQRVTAPGGSVLISVEIDHPPSDREPWILSEDGILRSFEHFEVAYKKVYQLGQMGWSVSVHQLMSQPERAIGSRETAGLILHLVKPGSQAPLALGRGSACLSQPST